MSCRWSFVQHYERIEPDYKYSLLSTEARSGTHPNPDSECGFSPRKHGNAQNSQAHPYGVKLHGILLNGLIVNKLRWFLKVDI